MPHGTFAAAVKTNFQLRAGFAASQQRRAHRSYHQPAMQGGGALEAQSRDETSLNLSRNGKTGKENQAPSSAAHESTRLNVRLKSAMLTLIMEVMLTSRRPCNCCQSPPCRLDNARAWPRCALPETPA